MWASFIKAIHKCKTLLWNYLWCQIEDHNTKTKVSWFDRCAKEDEWWVKPDLKEVLNILL
jgi:hypothetical protein